jgi:hypothetical protein
MNIELDLKCPTCGEEMEVMKPESAVESPANLLRVCNFCFTLAWNNEDGTLETRAPQRVDPKDLPPELQ